MTDLSETVAELRRLDAAATPGDWKSYQMRGYPDSIVWAGEPGPDAIHICEEGSASDSDAALIATLRNALPALLAAAEDRDRLRADRDQMRQALETVRLIGGPDAEVRMMDIARAALSASRDLDRGEGVARG